MKFDIKKTKEHFDSEISEKYFDYLKSRFICSNQYIQALKEGKYGFTDDYIICIEHEEYNVEYILGSSKESIYDLIRVNQLYELKLEEGTVFAVLGGDDYLFFKPNDEKVYFFYRDTEEVFMVAKDYNSFIKLCYKSEEK